MIEGRCDAMTGRMKMQHVSEPTLSHAATSGFANQLPLRAAGRYNSRANEGGCCCCCLPSRWRAGAGLHSCLGHGPTPPSAHRLSQPRPACLRSTRRLTAGEMPQAAFRPSPPNLNCYASLRCYIRSCMPPACDFSMLLFTAESAVICSSRSFHSAWYDIPSAS